MSEESTSFAHSLLQTMSTPVSCCATANRLHKSSYFLSVLAQLVRQCDATRHIHHGWLQEPHSLCNIIWVQPSRQHPPILAHPHRHLQVGPIKDLTTAPRSTNSFSKKMQSTLACHIPPSLVTRCSGDSSVVNDTQRPSLEGAQSEQKVGMLFPDRGPKIVY